ncbi:MAG: WD40 repeat domain-containing protein [Pseudomonadota bacterium]
MQSDHLDLKTLTLDAPATGCGFAGPSFVASDGDGNIHALEFSGAISKRRLHEGAVLSCTTDEKSGSVFTAGDDGKVFDAGSSHEPQLLHDGRKWVDVISASARGQVAWAAGKSIHLLMNGADEALEIAAPSSVGALTFSPDGKWLGAAVYGGALLIRLSDPSRTRMLEWQGSHNGIGFSPDGRFCVTSMLENALHVWRIDKPEDKHGRMGGYPAKPLSFSWTADERYLATAGADVLVLWPFIHADGPIGQGAGVAPAPKEKMLRSVASRPRSQQVGIGYVDGSVGIYDRKSQTHHPIAAASERGPVTELHFSADAQWLGFIREDGEVGLLKLGKP